VFNMKKVQALQRVLDIEKRYAAETSKDKAELESNLQDALLVARTLADKLGVLDNYSGMYLDRGFSKTSLNIPLLAKDLRADNDSTERAARLAPLTRKGTRNGSAK